MLVFLASYTKIMVCLDVAFASQLIVCLSCKSSNLKTEDFVNGIIILDFPLTIIFCK